ncbi:MAG: hypothetical protein C4B58_14470 [Deltaproteobacteria bacterium]|nr:MAG: hypothetical protein C4B58_14470 [Deltaproteobacteria bacterium]
MNDNENVRVANIIEDGRLGGPQIRIAEVAKRLKEKGIETTVIYPRLQSEAFQQRLDKYGIHNICLPLHRLTKDKKHLFQYFIFFFYELFVLYRFLKKEKFDIIHCSGGAWQYKGVIAGKMAGIKTLWHLNDTYMPYFLRFLFHILASRCADGFIVAGKRVEEYYIRKLGSIEKSLFEIQAPVDTSFFDPAQAHYDSKIQKKNSVHIVSVGNVNPLKGYEYFIQMGRLLNRQYDNLNFFIVGPHFDSQKAYSDKLHKLCDELGMKNLYFSGSCQDVRSVLKMADIYVCSSTTEASPLSVWEAMSMEKAIVSTNVADVSRFISNGENGFIVPTKDPEALAKKVSLLIKDTDLRKSFGRKARETAKKCLDIQIVVERHVEAYRTILGKKHRA